MLSFASATGNLFNRLGTIGSAVKQLRAYQTAQSPVLINTTTGIVAQYNSESDLQALIGSSYQSLLNTVAGAGGTLQTLASYTVNRMVYRDNPQPGQTINTVNNLIALSEVFRQMKAEAATVLAATVGSTIAQFYNSNSNIGNGFVVVSTVRPLDGRVLENAFAEDILLLCTADSYLGNATVGNEQFTVSGQGIESNVFAWDWPQGSGATMNVNAIDGSKDNSSNNLLTNSGWDAWTGSTPNDWTVVAGASTISKETSLTYDGAAAIKLTGDGASLTQFKQQFNSSAGTTGTLSPLSQYAGTVWLRRGGTTPSAGQMAVELVDQNGAVVNDAGGTPNQTLINLTGLSTVYAPYSYVFRTPLALPGQQWIQFRETAGNSLTGGTVYLDRSSLGVMSQLYTGGPFLSVHSGHQPFVQGDFATAVISNTARASGGLNTFQCLLFVLFPEVSQYELMAPSSSSPTISDGLIA